MKIKGILLLAFCVNITYICFGQAPDGRAKRVEELQKTYLTQELSLTPEESTKFFPVYYQYRDEIRKTRKGRGEDEIEFAEQLLAVRKKYRTDFKNILATDERVNKIFVAERNFQKILIEELETRKHKDRKRLTLILNITINSVFFIG